MLNQAQARNIGMRAASTWLAVLMDDDVLARVEIEPTLRLNAYDANILEVAGR